MMKKLLAMMLLCSTLSSCGYLVAGGAGYITGRELEEEQQVNEPEVYK